MLQDHLRSRLAVRVIPQFAQEPHRGDIPRGLLLRILEDAGATEAEFRDS